MMVINVNHIVLFFLILLQKCYSTYMYIQCIVSNQIKLYFTLHVTLFEQVCKEAFSSSKC